MFKALLNNEIVYSLDIRSVFGIKDIDFELKLRNASNSNLLKCSACNNTVILKSGDIKVPHFAHKDINEFCILYQSSLSFSEQHSKGVHFIYSYLKKFYSNFNIFVDYKLSDTQMADIYFSAFTKNIVFNYINSADTFYKCISKSEWYKSMKQNVIWIFSESLLQKFIKQDFIFDHHKKKFYDKNEVIIFLNTENHSITFLKYSKNISNRTIPIYKNYTYNELKYYKMIFDSDLFLDYFSSQNY